MLCLLLSATLGSCSDNTEPDIPEFPDTPDTGNRVCFRFNIYTDDVAPNSRALGEWEETPANVAERILNPEDMRVIILNADGQFVKSVKPTVLDYNEGITGDGFYNLSVFFEDSNLDKLNDDAVFNFRVIVLANINSIGGAYTTDAMWPGTALSKIQETFTMSPDWFPSTSKGIPMYGYKYLSGVSKAALMSESGADLGDISMLRALAKIEIKDAVTNTFTASDGKKYPYVDHVEMISWRERGNIVPAHNGYATPGSLKTANIPNLDSTPTTTPVTATFMDENGDGDGVFRLYCPEAKLADMSFRVYAVLSPGADPRPFDVSLRKYVDDGSVFGQDLVRNHIYRFRVNSFGTLADLDVTVAEWGHQVDEYELGNLVSMDEDGFLSWTALTSDFTVSATTYNGHEEQMLSMLNSTTDYATGTFHIVSPQGATWRAYFVPGENGVDAFEFVDVDAAGNVVEGSARSYAEGTVGERAVIHVRGKGPADIYRHYAELVIEVRTADGAVLYAPLTPQMSSRFIIYRENRL